MGEVARRNAPAARQLHLGHGQHALPAPDREVVVTYREDGPGFDAIRARMEELNANRETSQPIRSKTGGSTFKNPPGQKAWALIDEAGCRGLKIGDAQVSEKHTNFLINLGEAKAADIENLGEEVRKRVKQKYDIELRWEIQRLGLAKEGKKA